MSTSPTTNEREEGLAFQPKFDASGFVTCVATDAATGDVLMVAHMNDEALRKTIESGEAWYFSRSRNALWRKGETSGHTQRVVEMRLDCDQDAIWIRVEQSGAACHTGRHSCFYRKIDAADGDTRLSFVDADKAVRSDQSVSQINSADPCANVAALGASAALPPLVRCARVPSCGRDGASRWRNKSLRHSPCLLPPF